MILYRHLSTLLLISLNENRETSRKIAAILFAPILLYLSLKKQLVQLKFSGWVSFLSVSFLALLTITYSILIGNKAYNSTFNQFNSGYKLAIPFFFPSMVCEPSMISVCRKLNNKSKINIVFISLMTSICGIFIYGLVGHCGYIVFGECIKSTIIDELADMNSTLNIYVRNNTFDKYNILSRLSVYSMICVLVCGFPISMVPITDMFMTYFSKGRSRNSVILTLFFSCLILVFIEKLNIKTIKRISGAIFSSSVGLVHPFVFHLNSNLKDKKLRKIFLIICTLSILIISYIICTIFFDIWNNEL
ncbi:amino acid permease [Vairimorpha apis BRL 01]|uniref:Amino acid permease n=1 Tax=Vairimorpha apis BRL 01 TaxID=1037528 RepID=T0LBR8_9MICR|nr:amino acid permease [Vairimorpha apis BRL 01]